MEEFVEFLVLSLVQNKQAVKITSASQDNQVVITVKVDEQDLGRIIGKNGKIAQAIRMLVGALAKQKQDGKNYTIKFE